MVTRVKIDRVDLVFRAFSDRTRLRILSMLLRGLDQGRAELCVCHIVEVLGVPQPKVSRHLAYLKKAGLVVGRKQGLWMYYSLAPASGKFHAKLLECLGCCFQDVPELGRDGAKLVKVCCGGECCT